MGVLISRSSVNVYQINKLWVLPILQLINVVLFTCEAIYRFVPSIIIVAIFIVIEGLFGGASYVNTFFKVSQEVSTNSDTICIELSTVRQYKYFFIRYSIYHSGLLCNCTQRFASDSANYIKVENYANANSDTENDSIWLSG